MDTANIKLTSEEWEKQSNWKVLDLDGWDRKNFNYSWYEELITYDEFMKRLIPSTIMGKEKTSG